MRQFFVIFSFIFFSFFSFAGESQALPPASFEAVSDFNRAEALKAWEKYQMGFVKICSGARQAFVAFEREKTEKSQEQKETLKRSYRRQFVEYVRRSYLLGSSLLIDDLSRTLLAPIKEVSFGDRGERVYLSSFIHDDSAWCGIVVFQADEILLPIPIKVVSTREGISITVLSGLVGENSFAELISSHLSSLLKKENYFKIFVEALKELTVERTQDFDEAFISLSEIYGSTIVKFLYLPMTWRRKNGDELRYEMSDLFQCTDPDLFHYPGLPRISLRETLKKVLFPARAQENSGRRVVF